MWSSNLDRESGTKSSGSEGQCRCRSREMTVTSGHPSSSSCLSCLLLVSNAATAHCVGKCIRMHSWNALGRIGVHWDALVCLGASGCINVPSCAFESDRAALSGCKLKMYSVIIICAKTLIIICIGTFICIAEGYEGGCAEQWVAEKQSDKPVLTSSKSSNTSSSSPSCTLYTHDPEKTTLHPLHYAMTPVSHKTYLQNIARYKKTWPSVKLSKRFKR